MTGRSAPNLLAVLAALAIGCGDAVGPSPPTTHAAAPDAASASPSAGVRLVVREFDVVVGSHPHDVAPAADGGVWYTGQRDGTLGHLDPATGEVFTIPLGVDSAPHGVITGPDGNAWITDDGQNAIVRVDPTTRETTVYPLPSRGRDLDLNTAAFDGDGVLWFTGQNGFFGELGLDAGEVAVHDAPEGRGPYGITATPSGDIWYASLAGSHIARIDRSAGTATIVEPPTPDQGARRIWSDSRGRLWVSEWNAGQVSVHDPADGSWRQWRLPGDAPQAYAVYVDDRDIVWLTDFGSNAIVRFDPTTESFTSAVLPSAGAAVRQLLGRPGEVWGAGSARDKLVLVTEE